MPGISLWCNILIIGDYYIVTAIFWSMNISVICFLLWDICYICSEIKYCHLYQVLSCIVVCLPVLKSFWLWQCFIFANKTIYSYLLHIYIYYVYYFYYFYLFIFVEQLFHFFLGFKTIEVNLRHKMYLFLHLELRYHFESSFHDEM